MRFCYYSWKSMSTTVNEMLKKLLFNRSDIKLQFTTNNFHCYRFRFLTSFTFDICTPSRSVIWEILHSSQPIKLRKILRPCNKVTLFHCYKVGTTDSREIITIYFYFLTLLNANSNFAWNKVPLYFTAINGPPFIAVK